MITLNFIIDPMGKERPRATTMGNHVRVYTPKKTKDFEKFIATEAMKQFKGELYDGPLFCQITFYIKKPKSVTRKYPSVKPDIDNLEKILFDGLNGVVWTDDARVVRVMKEKAYADEGSILIKIKQLE